MALAIVLVLALAGFVLGRRRGRAAPYLPVPVLRWGIGLLALMFALIPLSGLLGIDALGWMGGLSLMFLLPTLAPFLIGYGIGWAIAARRLPLPAPWRHADIGTEGVQAPPLLDAQRIDALLVVAGVGAGFMIVIGAGYFLNDRSGPALLGQLLWPGLALMAAIIAVAVRRRSARRHAAS